MILLLDITVSPEAITFTVRRPGKKDHTHEYPATPEGARDAAEAMADLLEQEVR